MFYLKKLKINEPSIKAKITQQQKIIICFWRTGGKKIEIEGKKVMHYISSFESYYMKYYITDGKTVLHNVNYICLFIQTLCVKY